MYILAPWKPSLTIDKLPYLCFRSAFKNGKDHGKDLPHKHTIAYWFKCGGLWSINSFGCKSQKIQFECSLHHVHWGSFLNLIQKQFLGNDHVPMSRGIFISGFQWKSAKMNCATFCFFQDIVIIFFLNNAIPYMKLRKLIWAVQFKLMRHL